MDVFMEKMVTKRKTAVDSLIMAGVVFGIIVVLFLVINFMQYLAGMWLFIIAIAIYLGVMVIRTRNVEFEYTVTNGDLDVDRIAAQRKRKRIFSGSCKNFEIIASMKSGQYNANYDTIKNRIAACSSMGAPGVFFVVTNYKSERTILFFEPEERMLNNFKTFIPRKIFK